MNDTYLETSEQLHQFIPTWLHRNKVNIFKNISKCLIQGLKLFKYNKKCDVCDNIIDKDKGVRIYVSMKQ